MATETTSPTAITASSEQIRSEARLRTGTAWGFDTIGHLGLIRDTRAG